MHGEALLRERRMPLHQQPNAAGFFSLIQRRLRKDMIALYKRIKGKTSGRDKKPFILKIILAEEQMVISW